MPSADTQLLEAASDGNLSGVAEALRLGADVNARGEYGDTALNQAAEHGHAEVVEHLVAAGADVENLGGADKTPIMNAAFAGHVGVVKLLLAQGARVSDDLLSSVQMKVNILEENAENGMVNPQAAEAWKSFLGFLVAARLRQDLPEIVTALASDDAETVAAAAGRIETAAVRGVDISPAVPRLRELLDESEIGGSASAALAAHYAANKHWDGLRELLEAEAHAVKTGVLPELVHLARSGADLDVASLLPVVVNLLGASALNLRHDAAIVIGYLAGHGHEVSAALPRLIELLSDEAPQARSIAAWALYRIADNGGAIEAALPGLRALLDDEDENVRSMAAEVLELAGAE